MPYFGLVVNDKVVVGPRDWRYSFFVRYCEENDLDYSEIPTVKQNDAPFFGVGYSILPVTQTIYPTLGRFEQHTGPELTIGTDAIIATYGVAPKFIDSVKGEFLSIVANNRYIRETADLSLTIQETPVIIEADRLNKMMVIQIFGLMGLEDVYNFKFPKSQNWLALTKSDMATIVAAFVSQTQDAFDWENSLVTAIMAATDFDALGVIDLGTVDPMDRFLNPPVI